MRAIIFQVLASEDLFMCKAQNEILQEVFHDSSFKTIRV